MELESLGDQVMETILTRAASTDVAVFACVSPRCKSYASDDSVWRHFCLQDIGLLHPHDPDGNPCPSFKVAYKMWKESFGMYPWALVRRAKKCWDEIREWMMANFPEVANTLGKGASEAEIKGLEESLGVQLPLPTKVLYRFCNGQDTIGHDSVEKGWLAPLGVIGGYSFYEHVVNVHLLPLSLVVEETRNCTIVLDDSVTSSEYVVVACSSYDEKLFLLNCNDGQLYVGTSNLEDNWEMLPCVPCDLIKLDADLQQDAMLLWLEEHARNLRSGNVTVRPFYKSRSINLFPELPPSCSTAVTHGVQVRASALLIPEFCNLNSDVEKFFFSYSIRMRLLPEGCRLDGMHFSSCQLLSRHWIIRANDEVQNDVHGEAVTGKFPLLSTNKGNFVYESCTPLYSSQGSVEGSFTFVPGRLTNPEGRQFEVEVGRFGLEVPRYIF